MDLLEYLAPSDGRPMPPDLHANDVLHWQTTVETSVAEIAERVIVESRAALVSPGFVEMAPESAPFSKALLVRDPDGHAVRVVSRNRERDDLGAMRSEARSGPAPKPGEARRRPVQVEVQETVVTAEERRLEESRERRVHWKRWGPYLSERAWGTVREDYSEDGTAWDYLPHDHARSRAYRWNEDGIAGICDRQQRVCLALALWNGRDPILKERIFGLTGSEGNHGEDVKEYYFYLDSTPTHSYMRYLYKYPQAAFPYARLVDENRRRGKHEREFELVDTGVFDGDRYFDVCVEYAKVGQRGSVRADHGREPWTGRGAAASASDDLVPQHLVVERRRPAPSHAAGCGGAGGHVPSWPSSTMISAHAGSTAAAHLFCTSPRTTRTPNGCSGTPNGARYFKDGINEAVVNGRIDRGQSRADGHARGGALHAHRARRRHDRDRPAPERQGPRDDRRSVRRVRGTRSSGATRRRMRSTRPSSPPI